MRLKCKTNLANDNINQNTVCKRRRRIFWFYCCQTSILSPRNTFLNGFRQHFEQKSGLRPDYESPLVLRPLPNGAVHKGFIGIPLIALVEIVTATMLS